LKRAQKHEELLRKHLEAASKSAANAYLARDQAKEKMHAAYESRERAVDYLSKINDHHQMCPDGSCSCGRKGCSTSELIYEQWPQAMIKKLETREKYRREALDWDDWD
jgi:hypothetical protein